MDYSTTSEKYRLVLWGRGFFSRNVLDALDFRKCLIVGWIDKKYGSGQVEGETYYRPDELSNVDYDYIIVTAKKSESIRQEIKENITPPEKVIYFWDDNKEYPFIDTYIGELRDKIRKLEYQLENSAFELGTKPLPHILSLEETLELLIKNHKSLCRFGDGEFRWIIDSKKLDNRIPVWFQDRDNAMVQRLKEVIEADDDRIIIAISDIFGSLEDFVQSDKDFYREFFNTDNLRKRLMEIISLDRKYGNAFVSRPYWHYPDKSKERCDRIFDLWKRLWCGRDILIVEGEYVRMGMGNNLFDGCKCIRRILCPHKNAFQYYDEILSTVKECAEVADLILIALGPTATIMAYDLAVDGYQAIDIGQLDSEYEWYQRGTTDRIAVPGKGVAEAEDGHIPDNQGTDDYRSQICRRIHTVKNV